MAISISRIAQELFRVRPEETRRATYGFVYLFAAIGAFILARITRSVLFLEIPNYRDELPLTYIAVAVSVSLTMLAYTHVERRWRRDKTNAVTLTVLLLGTMGFRLALMQPSTALYWAFYLWVEIFGTFLVVQFWSMANEMFHARQAKRLFAVIGGGGVLANVLFGFATTEMVGVFGTENLLFAIAGCLVVALLMVQRLSKEAATELNLAWQRAPGSPNRSAAASAGRVFATRHVQLIAAVVMLTYLVSTVVDYQFQVIIGDSIPGKDARSAYLGAFFGVTGILGGIIQLFFTARILERFGVLVALALLPLGMLMGSGGLLLVPVFSGLSMVSMTKGAENVLRYTINDSTLQLLYLPLPAHLRGRAKALIDGTLKPLAVGGAGLLLALLVGQVEKLVGVPLGLHISVYDLSYVSGVTLLAWLMVTIALKQEYITSLVQTLQRRRLNFADSAVAVADESVVRSLSKALFSCRITDVVHALELLCTCAPAARRSLDMQAVGLLNHVSDDVREAALRYLARADMHPSSCEPALMATLLKDNAPGVRAAAAQAVYLILPSLGFASVHPLLDDPSLKVRAHAVAALVRHGGIDGILACADLLKRMLNNVDARERQHAAWILGEVGVQSFYQPLVPLLKDPDEVVQRAALHAAGRLKSPGLMPHVCALLEAPRLGHAAMQALVAMGSLAVEPMLETLLDSRRPQARRAQACRVLAKLGEAKALPVLLHALDGGPWNVRQAAAEALASLLAQLPGTGIDVRAVDGALRRELQRAYQLVAVHVDMGPPAAGDAAVADALAHRLSLCKGRILSLLAVKYSADTMALVIRNLRSSQAATRAYAVEVLDNLLSQDEKASIIPLFDDAAAENVLQAVPVGWEVTRRTRLETLEYLCGLGDDPWLQSTAAHAVGAARIVELNHAVRPLLRHSDAVCRETAMWSLDRLGGDAELTALLPTLVADPAGPVQRFAAHLLVP